jgi:hypothetical protein
MGVASIVLAGLTSSYVFLVRSTYALGNYVEMNDESRVNLELFARDVRRATDATYLGPYGMTMDVPLPGGGTETVDYYYDPSKGELLRRDSSGTRTMLSDIRQFTLSYYTLRDNPTMKSIELKKVQLDCEMARDVLLHLTNTNHVLSARWMMRNKIVSN